MKGTSSLISILIFWFLHVQPLQLTYYLVPKPVFTGFDNATFSTLDVTLLFLDCFIVSLLCQAHCKHFFMEPIMISTDQQRHLWTLRILFMSFNKLDVSLKKIEAVEVCGFLLFSQIQNWRTWMAPVVHCQMPRWKNKVINNVKYLKLFENMSFTCACQINNLLQFSTS